MDEKARLLQLLADTRRESLSALHGIDEHSVVYSAAGWTLKDVLAHLTAWEEECHRSVDAYRQGGAYSIPNYTNADDYNARVYAERKAIPFEQVQARWMAVREDFEKLISVIEPEQLGTQIAYPSGRRGTLNALVQESAEHERDHRADILRAARIDSNHAERSQLQNALDSSRRELEAALLPLSPEALETVVYSDSGWRVKDLVAHVTVWEQEAVRSLKAFHAGGEYMIPGYVFGSSAHEDAFNAQVFEKCYDWDAARMAAEFQTTRSDLQDALGALPDAKFAGDMLCAWGARSTVSAMIADLVQHERLHLGDIKKVVSN